MGGASVPGSGDTVTFDASSGGGTVTLGYDPNVISITCGAFTGTLDFGTSNPTLQTFSASGTAIRGLTMGSGSWTITGNNGNIWDFNTITNLTFNRGTAVINSTYSGSVGQRSFFVNLPTVRPYRVNITAGTDTIDFSSGNFEDLDFTGFSGTLDTDAFTVAGNLTLSPTMTIPTSANALTFTATTTGKTITMNGVAFNRPITFNGVGGGWTLQDNLDMSGASNRALTLTNGSFNANNFNVTCGSFSNSGTGTRTLTMGSGTWTLTGNNTTIWSEATITNLTFVKGSNPIVCNYSGSTGTRTIAHGASTTLATTPDFNITAGTDTVTISNSRVGNIDFTGFSGTFTNSTRIIFGNCKFSTGMTLSAGSAQTTFQIDTGTQVLTTNGRLLDFPIAINVTGTSFQLGDNLTVGSSRTTTHQAGTFDLNNKAFSTGLYNGGGSTTRAVLMGSGAFSVTGTGNVWTTTSTNMTFTKGTGTIFITDNSSSTKTFAGGGLTFNNLSIPYGSVGSVTLTGANTFNTFTVAPSATPLVFPASTTTTVTSFNVNGISNSAGSRVAIISSNPGTPWTLSVSSGVVQPSFISLTDSTATGGARFYAIESTNVSGNTGWTFQNLNPTSSRTAKSGQVAKSGRVAVSGRVAISF